VSFLLRLIGLDAATDVGAIDGATWSVTEQVAPVLLYVVVGAGLLLACVNFLPQVRMRRAVRVWTFLLRLGMVALLVVVLLHLELHLELRVRHKQYWAVLVDDSGSMATADVDGRTRFAVAMDDLERIRQAAGESVKLEVRSLSGRDLGEEPGRGPTRIGGALERDLLGGLAADRAILLTDGRDGERRDFTHLGRDVAARGTELSVRLYGAETPPPDRGIFAQAERTVLRLGEDVVLRGSITGLTGQEPVTVQLKENGRAVRPITVAPHERSQFVVTHRPEKPGAYNYTLELSGADSLRVNDSYTVKVLVVEERIKVLLIEGFPRFEFKLVKVALEVDPMIDLTSMVHLPGGGVYVQGKPLHRNPEEGLITSQAELFKYDVVILRDVSRKYFRAGGDATESRLRNLVQFVTKRGGGLVVLGGQDVFRAGGYEDSPLMEVLPFDLSDHFSRQAQFEGMFFVNVPKTAYGHPILRMFPDPARSRERLNSLRQLDGSNNVGRFKPLATPLLTRLVKLPDARGEPVEREVPVMAYQPVGDGKVVAAAVDTFWRWQLQPDFDDPPLQTLLANVVRFVAPPPRTAPGQPTVTLADGSPQVGQELLLSTTLKDKNFDPICNADLLVTVRRPDESVQRIYPRDLPEQPGYYEYRVALDQTGPYEVQAVCGKEQFETSFVVEGSGSEYADLSPDAAAMRVLAAEAGGRLVGSADEWLAEAAASRPAAPAARDLPVWNSPAVAGLFVLLVCADCYIRKRQGLP